jgi:hypothetical protein
MVAPRSKNRRTVLRVGARAGGIDCRSDLGCGFKPEDSELLFDRFTPPRRQDGEWVCASAVRLPKPMAGACGRKPRDAGAFLLALPAETSAAS